MTIDQNDYDSLKDELNALKAQNKELRYELSNCKHQYAKDKSLKEENEELRQCIRTMAKLL